MPSPFPGMDPFLEHPSIFPDLHDSLIAALRETLNAALPPPYYAGIGTRVWLETTERRIGPDVKVLKGGGESRNTAGGIAVLPATAVPASIAARPVVVRVETEEIRETLIEIHASPDGERLVTTIEVLSLANKTTGTRGRQEYQRKQRELLGAKVHLVEIDLLRAGLHTTAVPRTEAIADAGEFDYHVCVHCFDRPDDFLVYPVALPQPLPLIAIPLLPEDNEVTLDLQALLTRCYDGGHYERRVRYDRARLLPTLGAAREPWLDSVLARHRPDRP